MTSRVAPKPKSPSVLKANTSASAPPTIVSLPAPPFSVFATSEPVRASPPAPPFAFSIRESVSLLMSLPLAVRAARSTVTCEVAIE
jgi:hypothetical protein